MDTTPNDSRALLRATIAGVLLSMLMTAATFTAYASEVTFLRYPLLGTALTAVALTGLSSGRLPAFNRTLWAFAPWWAKLSWLAIILASFGTFATISLAATVPTGSTAHKVLETRGIGAIATYFFLIAALRRNVDLGRNAGRRRPKAEPTDEDHTNPRYQGPTRKVSS